MEEFRFKNDNDEFHIIIEAKSFEEAKEQFNKKYKTKNVIITN
jgi:hypothetical protein